MAAQKKRRFLPRVQKKRAARFPPSVIWEFRRGTRTCPNCSVTKLTPKSLCAYTLHGSLQLSRWLCRAQAFVQSNIPLLFHTTSEHQPSEAKARRPFPKPCVRQRAERQKTASFALMHTRSDRIKSAKAPGRRRAGAVRDLQRKMTMGGEHHGEPSLKRSSHAPQTKREKRFVSQS